MDLDERMRNDPLLYDKLRVMAIYYHNCSDIQLLAILS